MQSVHYAPVFLGHFGDFPSIIKRAIEKNQHSDHLKHVKCNQDNANTHHCKIFLVEPVSDHRKLDKKLYCGRTGRGVILKSKVGVFKEKGKGLNLGGNKAEKGEPMGNVDFVEGEESKFDMMGSKGFGEIGTI